MMVAPEEHVVPIYASPFMRLMGVAWLLVVLLLVGTYGLFGSVLLTSRDAVAQTLVVAGFAMIAPATAFAAGTIGVIAWRLLQHRSARIVLHPERLTIHDKWFLREPLVIEGQDVASVREVIPPNLFQRAGPTAVEKAAGAVLLDWGFGFNTRVQLRQDRRFVEAIRTPPGKTAYRTITTNVVAPALLIRIKDQGDRAALQAWSLAATRTNLPDPEGEVQQERRGVSGALIAVLGYVGFGLLCLGVFLGSG